MTQKRIGTVIVENGVNFVLLQRSTGKSQSPVEGIIDFEYPEFPEVGIIRYNILESDFKQFAVMWTCMDRPDLGPFDQSEEFMFILTRSIYPSQEIIDEMESYIDKFFDRRFVFLTDQTVESCPIRWNNERFQKANWLTFNVSN